VHCTRPRNQNVITFIETFINFADTCPDRTEPLKTQLWQYRDAISGTAITWGKISQLAALNEGIVREILTHHLEMSKRAIKKLSTKEKFEHATHAMVIDWELFSPAFELWKKARNPLAHGDYPSIEEWLNSDVSFEVYDSLVNTYNQLALLYIGFPSEKINFKHPHYPLG